MSLEVDGCEASLAEAETALGVVPRGFFAARRQRFSLRRFARRAVNGTTHRQARLSSPALLMAATKEPVNPFYVVVLAVGVLFLITAFAYGMLIYRALAPARARPSSPHPLLTFLDDYGMYCLGGELALLGVATVGALWLDQARSSAAAANDEQAGHARRSPEWPPNSGESNGGIR